MAKTNSNDTVKKLALGLAIVFMMNLFFNAGLAVFNPNAEYSDFCPDEIWADQAACEEYGGEWTEASDEYNDWSYCTENRDCWQLTQEANKPIEEINFYVLVGAGVIALVLGAWMVLPTAIANGLMYGGVLSILIGWARAAQYLDNLAHFVISGVFLVILFWVGVKKLKD